MGSGLTRAVARRLPPPARRVVRRVVDHGLGRLGPVLGSLQGVHTAEPVVALTYDDGPDPVHTPAVLDALAEAGVTATFFQLVGRAERHPDLVRRVVEAGHEVALHGIDHTRLTELPPARVGRLLAEGRARLEAVAGVAVRHFRPAYGSQRVRTVLAIRRAGMEPVVWGPSAMDWVDGSPAEVAARAMEHVTPGDIVLLHDAFEVPAGDTTRPPTFDRGAVSRVLLASLAERGYRPTGVAGLRALGRDRRTAWLRP